jgi:hypothetical protein
MKKNARETLQQAVEQLFVRVHENLLRQIRNQGDYKDSLTEIRFEEEDENHQQLIRLCKEKIGFKPLATKQDVFYSIMKVYEVHLRKEASKINQSHRRS